MARTGFYFQRARGRALVRSKRMKLARALKRALVAGRDFTISRGRGRSTVVRGEESLRRHISYAVRDARRAHREWRKYRALMVEFPDI